jgi:hypothetical protein
MPRDVQLRRLVKYNLSQGKGLGIIRRNKTARSLGNLPDGPFLDRPNTPTLILSCPS